MNYMKLFYKNIQGVIEVVHIHKNLGYSLSRWERDFASMHRGAGYAMTKLRDKRGFEIDLTSGGAYVYNSQS